MGLRRRMDNLERAAARRAEDGQRARWLLVELPDDAGGVEFEVYDLQAPGHGLVERGSRAALGHWLDVDEVVRVQYVRDWRGADGAGGAAQ